ncbi:hypothetical protein DH2020_011302 [Rehmannia glutinosa]|uniref:VQ domain-containing protein n=1 Tax=Rehmannia glutinosa TaxID=99300 RepID=A0ABR0XD10_REHGL
MEGREEIPLAKDEISKPIRRRSRASRRTPTTLLNTDATNFRAMVQRFTGGPAATFAARSQIPNGGGATLNFMEHVNAAAARPAAGGFYVPYPNQLQQQQQQHMFMMDVAAMHGGGGGGGPSSQAAARPPGSSDGNENRDYDNYMF